MNTYKQKERSYFTNVRYDLVSLIPEKPHSRILEIGAGGGETLIVIKEKGIAEEVIGIELTPLEDSHQKDKLIDRFLFGNIETMHLPFPENYFDAIVCGDVLEHLVDPWSVIEMLTKYLVVGGVFIVSIPNIRFRKALTRIYFRGDFSYESSGIFDKTHLRFFCKQNMLDLLSSDQLKVHKAYPNFEFHQSDRLIDFINKTTFRFFEEFLALQFILVSERIK
jgi:SAM-dependent methyltransferase